MALVQVKGIEMYGKTNILKDRAAKYADVQIFRNLQRERIKAEVERLEGQIVSAKNLEGTMLYPGDESIKLKVLELATVKEKLKAVNRLPEAKWSFNSDADKALRKEWKTASTDTLRGVAIAHWFQSQGCPCSETNTACFELGQWFKKGKGSSLESICMDGADWETQATNFPFADLMRTVVDWCFDLSLMKPDMFPAELEEIYTQKREEAKKRREERKNKKARKAQSATK